MEQAKSTNEPMTATNEAPDQTTREDLARTHAFRMLNLDERPKLAQFLEAAGFYTAPASKKHHGAYKGGLFDHSFNVVKVLEDLTARLDLSWERKESPYIIGLLHDVCKLDDYVWEQKDDEEKVAWNKKRIYPGHGDKSLVMLAGLVDLTEEEKLCIRYHMGAFTDEDEWKYYTQAVKICPNVLCTHTADMIASQLIER